MSLVIIILPQGFQTFSSDGVSDKVDVLATIKQVNYVLHNAPLHFAYTFLQEAVRRGGTLI